jgi:hypothetical protein
VIRGGAGELTRGVAGEGQVVEVLSLAAVLGRVVLAEWSWQSGLGWGKELAKLAKTAVFQA